MPIALFYLPPSLGGGSTSFTAHLFKSLLIGGYEPNLFRIKPTPEERERPFGKYDSVSYRNITAEDAIIYAKMMPSLLTGPTHSKHLPFAPDIIQRLMKVGMQIVVHDPNEFKVYDHLNNRNLARPPIIIRPTMGNYFPKAKFIPHPYVRQRSTIRFARSRATRPWSGVSIARLSFVKRPLIILEANSSLPPKYQCILRGAENRMFTRFKVLPLYPKFKQGGYGFPATFDAPVAEAEKAMFAVDMTYFPNDGGGSQYTFMEAWDAGTVNIIHQDWLRYKGEMSDENCITVGSAEQLATVLEHGGKVNADLAQMVNNGYASLVKHEPKRVAKQYVEELMK